MEQKIYELHYEVTGKWNQEEQNLDALVERIRQDGYVVKQISSCSSCKVYTNQGSSTYVHIFLLAEKEI